MNRIEYATGKQYRHRGYTIVQVVQDSGRKTYDIYDPNGEIWEWAAGTLAVARATINAVEV